MANKVYRLVSGENDDIYRVEQTSQGVNVSRQDLNVFIDCLDKRGYVVQDMDWRNNKGGTVCAAPKEAVGHAVNQIEHALNQHQAMRAHLGEEPNIEEMDDTFANPDY